MSVWKLCQFDTLIIARTEQSDIIITESVITSFQILILERAVFGSVVSHLAVPNPSLNIIINQSLQYYPINDATNFITSF